MIKCTKCRREYDKRETMLKRDEQYIQENNYKRVKVLSKRYGRDLISEG